MTRSPVRRASSRVLAFTILLCCFLSLLVSSAMLRGRGPVLRESDIGYRPIQAAGDGYVSSNACKACHPAQYETWHRSYHRTMTQVATPQTIRADFDHARVDAVYGKPMQLERRGSDFWAEFD